jgi:murein DD-endopeptidase MepM/ murein hydrolase activator NlpD
LKQYKIITNVINWLKVNSDRYFPTRQLYFRTNGDISFITISKNTQIFASLLIIIGAFWVGIASYNYIYISEIIGGKDTEVDTVNRQYQKLEKQYSQLKNDIEKSTMELEQRQLYIQQIIDENESLLIQKTGSTADDIAEADEFDEDDLSEEDKEARNLYRDSSLDRIFVNMKRLEKRQNETTKSLLAKFEEKLNFTNETLKKAGIPKEKFIELAKKSSMQSSAQGGPLLPLSKVFSKNDLYDEEMDELYNKGKTLRDLQMALAFLPTAIPTEKYYISSKFGVRRDPITRAWAQHNGLDMAGWRNTNINAGGDGVVKRAGRNGAFGLFIEIDHGNGFRTRYGHLSKLKVKTGDKVTENQLIGFMGSSGRSTSTHLHYEIWFNGKPIDPMKVFKAANDVQKIKEQQFDS